MAKFVVRYEVEGFEGVQEAGPYDGHEEAAKHLADIAGYEGVKNVVLERHRPKVELPEVPAYLECSECGFGQHADRRTGSWFSSMVVTEEGGTEFRFQCCPRHAQMVDGKFAPIELDGFETWINPGVFFFVDYPEALRQSASDHVVAAEPEEGESAASEGRSELSPQTPSRLGETIKEALAHHEAEPLKWEKIERAWDPVSGEYVFRPVLGRVSSPPSRHPVSHIKIGDKNIPIRCAVTELIKEHAAQWDKI